MCSFAITKLLHKQHGDTLIVHTIHLKLQTNMMHLPSFLVGSAVAGGGFLLIHRELSHRERLSKKWLLREKIEKEAMNMWNEARKSISGSEEASSK